MKISEIGKYYLLFNDDDEQKISFSEEEMIGIFDNTIKRYDKNLQMTKYNTVIYIHILDDCAELVTMYSQDASSNISPQKLYIDKTCEMGGNKYLLKYDCKDDYLEEIFNSFKTQTLEGYYDIRSLLIKYAKKRGMTSKQAVGHMVTKIDVPEVDVDNF